MVPSLLTALEDFNILSHIVSLLVSPQDLVSASSVNKLWNESVSFKTRRISIKSRALLYRFSRIFPNIKELNLDQCCDKIEDSDIDFASFYFKFVESLSIGHPDSHQTLISDHSIDFIASRWPNLNQIGLFFIPNLSDKAIISLVEGCPLLQSISLQNCVHLGDETINGGIAKCKYLQELSLRGKFNFTPSGLSLIGQKCATLHRICFEFSSLDIGLAIASISHSCSRMQEISLKVRNVDLRDVARITTLTSLRVETDQWPQLDEAVVSIVQSNRNLKEIVIMNQHQPISDMAVIEIIRSCHMLVKLHIHATRLTGVSLQCLMDCKSIRSLTLVHFKSSGQEISLGLCGLDLTHLSMRSGRGIRDIELQMLVQGSKNLELLDLSGCNGLSPIGFSAISSCTNLHFLNLSFTKVDNLSLMAIANNIKSLKKLSLVKCESISDAGIVARFSTLESLNLDECPWVSDEGLSTISQGCRRLAHLSLGFTRITDKGLYNLTECKFLRSLRISYCKSVEGPGLVAVVMNCPLFHYVVMSHRFKGSETLQKLNKQFCIAHLEADDMALIPFGFNLLM